MAPSRLVAVLLGVLALLRVAEGARADGPHEAGDSPLPLPHTLPLHQFQPKLYRFLDERKYDEQPQHLGWKRDKCVRDTGEYMNGISYGTHAAVRVYYSPAVIQWLEAGRTGPIPDGATIVKEQYPPPAARYLGLSDEELRKRLVSWTVMIKDAAGSRDGWFWVDYAAQRDTEPRQTRQLPDTHDFPFTYPSAGFGQYCIRCHASAERESTFITLKNVAGYPGDPLTFRVDDSWKMPGNRAPAASDVQPGHGLGRRAKRAELALKRPPIDSNFEFLRFYSQIARVHYYDVKPIPNVSYDRVFPASSGPARFLTSDQCMSCHGGLSGPFQAMFLPIKPQDPNDKEVHGFNFSPHGEWRWSLMGLAGRDPVFYAQLETELMLHSQKPGMRETIADTCFRCHGAMGQRQYHQDTGKLFPLQLAQLDDPRDPNLAYAALARDGVSCTVCHRMVDAQQPLEALIMGNFQVSQTDEIYGPYADKDIATLPMKNGLNLTPKQNPYLKSARMCASCHVLRVPVYDAQGNEVGKDFEQATYLEWLNSRYENEVNPNSPSAKTCQQCHMPGEFHLPGSPDDADPVKIPLTRIATIEDDTYPAAENRAPAEKIHTGDVKEYARHELLGINAFVLEMFNQFENVLGVRKVDFMTGAVDGLSNAMENAVHQARNATATVEILSSEIRGEKIITKVKVTNLAGHRFPTGVGFRRAFLEFQVIETSEGRNRMAWNSGRTNNLGVLVDDQGRILPSEFFDRDRDGRRYQPHYQTITEQDQVQIYQQLATNPQGCFTTSFLEQHTVVKDNRLLPKGWSRKGPGGSLMPSEFLKATHPVGVSDSDYEGDDGADIVVYEVRLGRWKRQNLKVAARLFYQSVPPFYLKMRFETAQGDATQRLHYLCSHLNLQGTPMADWKLLIDVDEADVKTATP